MLKKLLFFSGRRADGAPSARRAARRPYKNLLQISAPGGAPTARRRRATRRGNPNFSNFKNFEKVKKLFQQIHYMKIWSRGILNNDVLHLWMNPRHSYHHFRIQNFKFGLAIPRRPARRPARRRRARRRWFWSRSRIEIVKVQNAHPTGL